DVCSSDLGALLVDLRRLEVDGRELRDVEEIRRAEVVVACLDVRVEARRVDRQLRGLERAVRIGLAVASERVEAGPDRRDHEMLDGEFGSAMGGIECPLHVRLHQVKRVVADCPASLCGGFHLPSSIFHRTSQNPGPSVAISNNCPSGAEKLMLEKNGLPTTADTSSSIERNFFCHPFNSSRSSALNAPWFVCPTPARACGCRGVHPKSVQLLCGSTRVPS